MDLLYILHDAHDLEVLEATLDSHKLDDVEYLLPISLKLYHLKWNQGDQVLKHASLHVVAQDLLRIGDRGKRGTPRIRDGLVEAQKEV